LSREQQILGDVENENQNDLPNKGLEEQHMCPVCIASTAVMVAGAGSAGGIVAVCLGRFRGFFKVDRLGLRQKAKEN
jgi:hypothetical protein